MNPNLIYLVQTDTTVGFSSSNDEKLSSIKKRSKNQKILRTLDSLKTLKTFTRVPNKFKKLVRKSKKTTFIYPNLNSFRLVEPSNKFFDFIDKFKVLYSSSANETTCKFDNKFALDKAEVIVEDKRGFFETKPSKIYKLSKKKISKLR